MLPFLFFYIFLFLYCCPKAIAGNNIDELIQQARKKNLSQSEIWLRLVHYQPNWLFSGYYSLADDPNFFLSPNGPKDPSAELEETLRAFAQSSELADEHPQCRFPARYHFLKTELGFSPEVIPQQVCKRFNEWRSGMDVSGITLIFPAAYLNNPASMFGHTLMRLDGHGQNESTRLLAYGATYAAATEETGGLLFAVRGVFGGYKGAFSLSPYYKMVRKYGDIEHRDIWEYELDFSQEEQEQIVRHLWELGQIFFDYFFFDENCSYHLLSIFEAVRPSLKLTDEFRYWAIPADTVKSAIDRADFVRNIAYRPASTTIINYRASKLNEEEQQLARALADGELKTDTSKLLSLMPEAKARVLELAYDFLSYLVVSNKIPESVGQERGQTLLIERAKIPVDIPALKIPTPKVRPDQSHETARISIGTGLEEGRWFHSLGIRPAYHDLMDPSGGYVDGAELRFLELNFRGHEADSFKLDSFTFLGIRSLTSRSLFLKPFSWKFDLDGKRLAIHEHTIGTFVYRMNLGLGIALPFLQTGLFYVLPEVSARYNNQLNDNYALGGGVDSGLLFDLSDNFRTKISFSGSRFGIGDSHDEGQVSLEQRYSLDTNNALYFVLGHSNDFNQDHDFGEIRLQHYF